MKALVKPELLRVLRVVAMSDEERLTFIGGGRNINVSEEARWFLEHSDRIMPTLHDKGWVEHVPFNHKPGALCASRGRGDLQMVVITEAGRQMLA